MSLKREGEIELGFDPGSAAADASLVFIGRVRSPWSRREDCPKNMRIAREAPMPATVEIDPAYRAGLAGLERVSHIALLTWLDRAPRNLIVQRPRHSTVARGTFAIRSPARPNPVGLHVTRLLAVDAEAGILHLEAIDVLDGTPVIDVKPYHASADAIPEATVSAAT